MKGQRIGYVRVSTFDQNVDRQLDGQSLDRIFTDKASGKDINRPELDAMLAFAREGDTVVVHSMDRLARNLDDLRKLVQSLTKRGVRIEFVKESLAFSGEDSPMANLMLSVMGAFAEFERALIRSGSAKALRSPDNAVLIAGGNVPSPTKWSPSCTAVLMTASARPSSPVTWGSVAKPSTSISALPPEPVSPSLAHP